jgi:non-heme chloroperoxidase
MATIVLIHGLWMTPRSWDPWATRFRSAGHTVLAPGWPGVDERSVQDIRSDPAALKGVGLAQIADHYERIIRSLPDTPIIMGHSFGGVLTQMLADRDLGAAYVGVAPGPPAGVPTLPLSTLRSGLPVLWNPLRRNGASPISRSHFRYTFCNDLTRAESDAVWEESAINSYNRVLFEGALASFAPRSGISRVDFGSERRSPLLLILGDRDHVVPAALGRATLRKYRESASSAVVDYREYPGRTHRLVSQEGWEEIADFALEWAVAHAVAPVEPARDEG